MKMRQRHSRPLTVWQDTLYKLKSTGKMYVRSMKYRPSYPKIVFSNCKSFDPQQPYIPNSIYDRCSAWKEDFEDQPISEDFLNDIFYSCIWGKKQE